MFSIKKEKSQRDREKVIKAKDVPIHINYINTEKTLEPSLIEEAITISDLFSLNELSCVELLLEAEGQMQYFYGFNRGLTAILLYYDSKKIMINCLKALLSARSGRTWVLDEAMPSEISHFISEYVNKLVQNGVIKKLLGITYKISFFYLIIF